MAVTLAACSPQTELANTVREASPEAVANCTRLGRVRAVPGLFGPFARVGVNDARRAAKRAAYEQGATDVVFDPMPQDSPIYEVTGTAYRC
jgi:hypothetical protein